MEIKTRNRKKKSAGSKVIGWCVRCKSNRAMVDREVVTWKNGRKAFKGKCQECDCTMSKLMTKEEIAENE